MVVNTTALLISARDGYPLAATLYEGAPPDIVAVISSATAVKQSYYRRFATFLAVQGIPTLTFDYRGIGLSRPDSLKGFEARMSEWGTRDLPAAIDWLASRYPAARLFVVGHSVGGQLLGLAENNTRVHGLVAVCAQSGDWRLWQGVRRYLLAGLWYIVVPTLSRSFGYFPGRKLGLGEDLPGGVAREWAAWCRSRGYLAPHLVPFLPSHFGAFRGSILAYSFEDDPLAPRAAVESLLRLYARAGTICRRYLEPTMLGLPPVGHFGFFRKECAGLWPATAEWLRAAVGAPGVPASAISLGEPACLPAPHIPTPAFRMRSR